MNSVNKILIWMLIENGYYYGLDKIKFIRNNKKKTKKSALAHI